MSRSRLHLVIMKLRSAGWRRLGELVALPPECIITYRATAEWVIIHS